MLVEVVEVVMEPLTMVQEGQAVVVMEPMEPLALLPRNPELQTPVVEVVEVVSNLEETLPVAPAVQVS